MRERVGPLAILLLAVFGSELAVMLTFDVIGKLDDHSVHFAFFDAGCVALVTAPLIWHFLIQRMWRAQRTIEKLAIVADNCQHGVVIADANGRVEWANKSFERMTGFTVQEVIGKKAGVFLQGPRTDLNTINFVRAHLQARKEVAVEIINYTKDGREFWNALKINPVLNEAGELVQYVGMQADITERKLLEEHLAQSKEIAESANRAKSEFLAVMSHELRTPLNGILGMNELLLNTELTEQQRRFVETCRSSGKLLLQQINDILDLSKIEAGKLELNVQACHLESLVFDIISVFTDSASHKGLALKCYVEPSACVQILADENRLRQVLVNLLGNALKFTASGDVAVRVDVTQRRERELTIRFSVTDTGLGIPAERRDRLFCPFSQVDSSTTRNYGGTGLGLSICKQLVELMGGQIDVESQVGVGSTFWFELPLEILPDSLAKVGDCQGLRGKRVLVVAAPERKHAQIDDCLKEWGCHSESATSLREALSALVHAESAGAPFEVVLLDVYTATGESAVLLQELIGRKLPTIGWGLSADEQTVARGRGHGPQQWLRDPVRPRDLHTALATALGMACAPPLEAALGSAAEPPRLEITGHVLVAEDNRINQMYIVELLKQCGCTCDLAANGHEALEAVQQRRYDLVLMDCQMPEMDGLTATREIRRREALQETSSHLPIVALTANALQGDRERCLEAGMDDYLTKPLEPNTLYATLKKTIGPRSEEHAVSAAPPQASTLAVAPIDAEGLLARCFGNLDFAWSLLEEFETSGSERVEAIRRSAAQQDAQAAAEAAHALKGAAGILCATSLSKVAAQVEAQGRSGDIAEIGPLVDDLAHELQKCLTYLPTLREETRTVQNARA